MDNNQDKNPLEEVEGTGYIEQVEIDHEMRTAGQYGPELQRPNQEERPYSR